MIRDNKNCIYIFDHGHQIYQATNTISSSPTVRNKINTTPGKGVC